MLKMIIVDDEYLVRKGLQTTIDWAALGIDIIGEASDGEEGLELVKQYHPDIIITDIRMPIMDGIELMEHVRQHHYSTSIIVLSGFDEFDFAKKAIENGAMAYLLKPIDNTVLYDTMKSIVKKILDQKSTENYYTKLQQELTTIKKQFILDLIHGNISDLDVIQDKIQFLGLPFNQDNQIVLILQLDKSHILSQTLSPIEQQQLMDSIEENISKYLLLTSEYYGIFVKIKDFQWAIVLQCMISDFSKVYHQIKLSCKSFFEKMENPYTYSIGISHATTSLLNIHDQYKKACDSANHKLLLDTSTATIYEDLYSNDFRKEINDAIGYINEHYSENLTVKGVAEALHLSASHLMRLFKSEVGITFIDYLTSYRIKIAEELLSRGNYKIYEVSNKIGYSDVKYFSQLFKKNTGYTPREYKKYATNSKN